MTPPAVPDAVTSMGEAMTSGAQSPVQRRHDRGQVLLAVVGPVAFVTTLAVLDLIEGPRISYGGVIAVIPMFAAIQGTPRQVLITGAYTFFCGVLLGVTSEEGMSSTHIVRLSIIALSVLIAALSSRLRILREAAYQRALGDAEHAEQLRRLAQTDELTGLLNRRGLITRLQAHEHVSPVTLAVADCDDLKTVNDQLGHHAGDEYIQAVAGRLSRAVSRGDIVARWGGDEFLLIVRLPPEQGRRVLERARSAIAGDAVRTSEGLVSASISIGAAPWLQGEALDEALRRADAALYQAKRSGRNAIFFRDADASRPVSGLIDP